MNSMLNFERNWHIVSVNVNDRYCWMKQCVFQDNAWALFSDIKVLEYNFAVLALDDYLNQQHLAQSSPPFHKSHREEGIGGQPTQWQLTEPKLKHKKKAYLFCSCTKTWVQLIHKKRANLCWRRRRWTKSQTELKLSAELCNEMFSWSFDLEQDNI